MPDDYRFRQGWGGRLVLQRYIRWTAFQHGYSYDAAKWRDATVEDMTHFFQQTKKEST